MAEKEGKSTSIKSIEKAIAILECFSKSHPALSLTEISQDVDMPLSTTSRFVATLVEAELLEREESSRRYLLGSKLYYLGMIARDSMNLRRIAYPFMEELCKMFLETVNLFVRIDDERICYEQIESPLGLRRSARLGESLPLWAGATGKCFLLQDSLEERRRIFRDAKRLTDNTILDFDELNREVEEISIRGYAVSHGEREEGVVTMSSPIFDASEKIVASIAISSPSVRMKEEKIQEIGKELTRIARVISSKLGYK